jgi:hypothetical protein
MPAPFQFTLVKTPVVKALVTKGPTGPAGPPGEFDQSALKQTIEEIQFDSLTLFDSGANSIKTAIVQNDTLNIGGSDYVKASVMQAALTGYQPVDSDLTAIAALATTAYGRALLTLANQAALQSAIGTLPVANGGTGVTTSTGSGNNVLSASPTFTGTLNAAAISASGTVTLTGSSLTTYQNRLTLDASNYWRNDGVMQVGGGVLLGASGGQWITPTQTQMGPTHTIGFNGVGGPISNANDITIGRESSGVMGFYTNSTKATKGSIACENVTASGTVTAGLAATPGTFAVVNATTATATLGLRRITDRGSRLAYPDGTNWRFLADDAIIS